MNATGTTTSIWPESASTACSELLSLHLPEASDAMKARIVERLLFGHHSHSFALTRGDMRDLGLRLRSDPATEDLAWEIARDLRSSVGGGARQTSEEDWFDTILATHARLRRRRRGPGSLEPRWEAGEIE